MDREKVIKGFECCFTDMNLSNSMPCRSCPYGSLPKKENCQKQMFADVLELLKEKETTRWKKISPAGIYECEKCGKHIISQDIECFKYCFNCGRSVKE